MKESKPSVDEILEITKDLETHYSEVQKNFKSDETFYDLDFKSRLELPKQFQSEGLVLPTARDMVDAFVDHINIDNARVFVNRKGDSQKAMEEAEMLRKFFLGLIHRTNVESTISPWRVAAKHYALYGVTVFEDVYDADRWIDAPVQEGEETGDFAKKMDEWRSQHHNSLPIVISAINPFLVMPDPSTNGANFVIKKQKRKVYEVKTKWPHWNNILGKSTTEEVDDVSYWDGIFRSHIIDSQSVLKVKGGVVKHKYGFIPFVIINAGLGNESIDGSPEKRYVGALRYINDLLIAESRDFSIADVVLKRAAWPWGFLKGQNAKAVQKIDMTYGTYNPLPDGVDVHEIVHQTSPEALNAHLYRTSDYISAHAAPRSIRGLPESGVRSGVDRRLMMTEAASKFRYSEQAFKNGTAKVLTNCALLLKNVIPGDVEVWARTPTDEFDCMIKKDQIKEPINCYVEFAPISEQDEYTRHDDLERLVNTGIATRRWARTQMSNLDPVQLERDEERQKIKDDPMVQQVVSQYVSAKLMQALSARGEAETIASPIMKGANPQVNPELGRMIPGLQNRPGLGSAEDMQNGLEKLRSQTPAQPFQGQGGGGARY
jgi:hypothetical protein